MTKINIIFGASALIGLSLINKITEIKKELEDAEKLKNEAKNLLSDYEKKIDKSKIVVPYWRMKDLFEQQYQLTFVCKLPSIS